MGDRLEFTNQNLDLTGVLGPADRAHRTIIAGEPDPVVEVPEADVAEATRGTLRSPWSDDQERGRTVALLLLKAAGSDEVRERDAETAVATVDTSDE